MPYMPVKNPDTGYYHAVDQDHYHKNLGKRDANGNKIVFTGRSYPTFAEARHAADDRNRSDREKPYRDR